jgi:hypothetical protein
VLIDGQGLPLGMNVASASPSDQRLIEPLLKHRILSKQSPRLLYDKAADGDPLRNRLSDAGIELICPHRKNRANASSLQASLESGTDNFVAGTLSPPPDPSRILSPLVPRLRSTRLYQAIA